MKADTERREYLCGLDLLGIGNKKVVDPCEHDNELSGYTVLRNSFPCEEALEFSRSTLYHGGCFLNRKQQTDAIISVFVSSSSFYFRNITLFYVLSRLLLGSM